MHKRAGDKDKDESELCEIDVSSTSTGIGNEATPSRSLFPLAFHDTS